MFRDFSDTSKQKILGLVSEVENEKLCDLTDWVGDCWYNFESWIGILNIKKYINDVNSYHKKVIDKNNATKNSIETIFNNVSNVNTTYSSIFSNIDINLGKLSSYIDAMNNIVTPSNGMFNTSYMSNKFDKLLGEVNSSYEQCQKDRINSLLMEIEDDNVFEMYFNEFKDYVGDNVNNYFENAIESDNWLDIIVNWCDWLVGDLYGGYDKLVKWISNLHEEYTFKSLDYDSNLSKFFDDADFIIDIVKEAKNAYVSGNGMEAYKNIGFIIYKKIVNGGNKYLNKKDNLKYLGWDKLRSQVYISTICNMPKNFVNGIEDYYNNGTGSAGSIFVETTVGAFAEAVAGSAKLPYYLSTALGYPIVDAVCKSVGYDLSGEYSRLTGEKGLKSVLLAQKELWIDIVYEGSKKHLSNEVDDFYNKMQKGWNNWKSGIKLMF